MARAASNFDDNKIMVKKQWCKGCGICAALCGNSVLLLDARSRAVAAKPSACTGCGKCEDHCPELAITVNRPAIRAKFATHPGATHRTVEVGGYGEAARA
ncbi:MAG: 4Fe-4S dicluster domain-containing protein [Firmicutes bacterium]|nr:4Fe-4S dicluster domain-containing protein [Bacillota bacterium]